MPALCSETGLSFKFSSSIKLGELGEILFLGANPNLEHLDGRKGDYICRETGRLVELKTDFYPMGNTANYFMERYSNESTQTPGGPWQSLGNGAHRFVYFYVKDLIYFEFDTKRLVDRLDGIIGSLTPTPIRNISHTTIGYRVPRDMLQDLVIEQVKLKVVKQ